MSRNLNILGIFVLMAALTGCIGVTKYRGAPGGSAPSGPAADKIVIKTDPESVEAGRLLFARKCEYCHDPNSNNSLVGPGFKGILKGALLPVSGRPATPENIASQMRHPFTSMPSFDFLPEQELLDIIAYLNTL